MGTRKLPGKPEEMLGGYLRWTPSRFMLQNRDKLRQ